MEEGVVRIKHFYIQYISNFYMAISYTLLQSMPVV